MRPVDQLVPIARAILKVLRENNCDIEEGTVICNTVLVLLEKQAHENTKAISD